VTSAFTLGSRNARFPGFTEPNFDTAAPSGDSRAA
jgi:hypothetical protein